MAAANSLSREDWIKAAFRALSARGIAGVRVEAIARDLKVSKGSFYWHFKNGGDLLHAMLDHWAKVATQDLIVQVENLNVGPRAMVDELIIAATSEASAEYGGENVEHAIREWGRVDPHAAKVVTKVDDQRLAFLGKLFLELGQDDGSAWQNARILYGALIGLTALSAADPQKIRADLLDLVVRLCAK